MDIRRGRPDIRRRCRDIRRGRRGTGEVFSRVEFPTLSHYVLIRQAIAKGIDLNTTGNDFSISDFADLLPAPDRQDVMRAWASDAPMMRLLAESHRARGEDDRSIADRLTREARAFLVRSPYQNHFRDLLARDPRIKSHVLDIGCGEKLQDPVAFVPEVCRQLDGLDPSEVVLKNQSLHVRWHAPLEQAPVPESAYDVAYAYNVVEHVPIARPFFQKVCQVLRPGGTFYALTPHSRHPFAMISRTLELAGVKRIIARSNENVNDYPSYYRLNSRSKVLAAIDGLDFDPPTFYYLTEPGWERAYFPRGLRWLVRGYDKVLGEPVEGLRLIFTMRLQRPMP
jgi:SAM-dependent methyltransferase